VGVPRQKPPRRADIRALMTMLLTPDRFTRRCAAELPRRISAREPEILRAYADVLIGLLIELPQSRRWTCRYCQSSAARLRRRIARDEKQPRVLRLPSLRSGRSG